MHACLLCLPFLILLICVRSSSTNFSSILQHTYSARLVNGLGTYDSEVVAVLRAHGGVDVGVCDGSLSAIAMLALENEANTKRFGNAGACEGAAMIYTLHDIVLNFADLF